MYTNLKGHLFVTNYFYVFILAFSFFKYETFDIELLNMKMKIVYIKIKFFVWNIAH